MPAGKITALRAQAKDPQRVNVFVDGEFAIGVGLTTITKAGLHVGKQLTAEEFARLERFDGDRFEDARDIFEEVTMAQDFPSFLTLPAYARYLTEAREKATVEELAAA